MTRSARPATLALLLLALAAPVRLLAAATPAQSPEELLDEIKRARDAVDTQLLTRLAQQGTEESLEALEEAVDVFVLAPPLQAGFEAFKHYRGLGELEARAIEFVAEQADAGHEATRRAAARGLSFFGEAASKELRRIVERSKDEVCRAWAVGPLLPGLGREGTEDALETVLGSARVGPSGTRPALLEHLAAFASPAHTELLVEHLEDRKTPDLTKVLLVEALARREQAGVTDALIDALGERSPDVQFAALRALDARGATTHLRELRKLTRSKDDAVRRLAVVSLARIRGAEEGWLEDLIDLSEDRSPAIRQGAVVGLAELRTPRALEVLYGMLKDPDRAVRAEVLQRVGNLRRKDSLPHLISRVNAETGRMKLDLLTVLRLITAEDNGTSYERWQRWWEGEREGFTVPPYEQALARERERQRSAAQGRTVTSFYGLEVVSDRVCFVLDTSGSMKGTMGDGRTRMEAAKEQLGQALRSFPAGDLFNVVFFSTDVMPWQDELVEMGEKTRAAALGYVERQVADGYTAVYDALKLAFEDERVDTLFLLTDGSPMNGTIDDPAEIRARVQRWNSTRHLRIHCVSIGGDSQLLRDLARDSGGEYRVVRQ